MAISVGFWAGALATVFQVAGRLFLSATFDAAAGGMWAGAIGGS